MDPKKYLSMEDAIKILNNIIEDYNNQYKSDVLNISIVALQKLIEEYNNLKQIEEAHRIENGKLREEIKDLEETLDNTWSGFKGIQEDLTNQLRNMPPAEYC